MKIYHVKLRQDVRYPAAWCFNAPSYKADEIVPVVKATNQPDFETEGKMFIHTPELIGDPYGILIDKSQYEIAAQPIKAIHGDDDCATVEV